MESWPHVAGNRTSPNWMEAFSRDNHRTSLLEISPWSLVVNMNKSPAGPKCLTHTYIYIYNIYVWYPNHIPAIPIESIWIPFISFYIYIYSYMTYPWNSHGNPLGWPWPLEWRASFGSPSAAGRCSCLRRNETGRVTGDFMGLNGLRCWI